MPRLKRVGRAGFYHVINRGVEKRKVFLDDPDHLRFLHLVDEQKALFGFDIRAYCLMPNHYHLLLEMKDESLSLVMKHIDQRYTQYFNKKYDRVGALWQGRFKSWFISDERYLGVLIKYIEQNPIKAGLCAHIGEYPWSTTITASAAPSTQDPTLTPAELAQLAEFLRNGVRPRFSLSDYFGPPNTFQAHSRTMLEYRNQAIIAALRDGYRKSEIARHLGLSDAAISTCVQKFKKRGQTLFFNSTPGYRN